jgi:hypothetical protein
MLRLVAVALLGLLPFSALASALVESFKGDVRAGSARVTQGQRIFPGASVTTGPAAQAVLRFDDGGRVVLGQNTDFRLRDYRYDQGNPRTDRVVLDLLKGAARFVTGALGRRSAGAFALRVPQATIGIRGTDFMVVIVNPAYIAVTEGAVGVSNAAGTALFGSGSVGAVASGSALASPIPAASLPSAASAAFSELGAVSLSGLGAAPAAGGPAGGAPAASEAPAAAPSVSTGVLIGVGAAAAAAAAGGGGGGGGAPSHAP